MELGVLREMFDGEGIRDRHYREHGKYEVYKLALAAIASRIAGKHEDRRVYESTILRVKPLTTLYEPGFKGTGDLNLETAVLVLIALYGEAHFTTMQPVKPWLPGSALGLLYSLSALVLIAISLRLLKRLNRGRGAG